MSNKTSTLVTLSGEYFEAEFKGPERSATRDGIWYLFHLKDLTKDRGERLVSIYRFGALHPFPPDFDARLEMVRLNIMRRAFDSGLLSFDTIFDEHEYKELQLEASDFAPQIAVNGQEVKQFIINKAYWEGFIHNPIPGNPIMFDTPADLDYLGVSTTEVKRYMWLLREQGFLDKVMETMGCPTAKLIELYESKQSISLPNEKVFPRGTQYQAFKDIKQILLSATKEIFIADNYLDDSILDMLEAMPTRPVIKLLTYKPPADFRVAVKRFQCQYQQTVEVKLHQKEVHDRAIVIDDVHFYGLGASIKGMGEKLSLLNKVEDLANIATLRSELQAIWASAMPLS